MFGFLRGNDKIDGDYYETLSRIHAYLKPANYAEIGIRRGESLKLASTAQRIIGIDPAPQLTGPQPPSWRVFPMTSDDFFAKHNLTQEFGGKPFDLAFVDGMHLFEFALRDFINFERSAGPNSTVLIHDCYPIDRETANRDRTTDLWSGDIWKLIVCLKKYRPDLSISTIDAPPTGLGVIRKLDPKSTVLSSRLEALCTEFVPKDYGEIEADKAGGLNRVKNRWREIEPILAA